MAQRPGHKAVAKTKRISKPEKEGAPVPANARPKAKPSGTARSAGSVTLGKATTEPAKSKTKFSAKVEKSASAAAKKAKAKTSAAGPGAKGRLRKAPVDEAEAKTGSNVAKQPKRATRAAPSTKLPKSAKRGAVATGRSVRKKFKAPNYLSAELGQPVDHEGEPIGAGSPRGNDDDALQAYALQLWRNMQSGGVVKRYMRAFEQAGLTVDEVWTVGLGGEARSTSSTPDEMRRYKQRLLFRANLLEALLTETIADLHRLEGIEPTPPQSPDDFGSAHVST